MKIFKSASVVLGVLVCLNAPLLALQNATDESDFCSKGWGKGSVGPTGPTGPQGPTGPTGAQGRAGQSGIKTYGSYYYTLIATGSVIPFNQNSVSSAGGITNAEGVFTVIEAGVYEISFGGESDSAPGFDLELEINGVSVNQPGTSVLINANFQSGSATSLQNLKAGDTFSITTKLNGAPINAFITIKKIA